MNTIGSRLREFIDKNFGQYREFAEKLGIHQSVLSQYMNDKVLPGSDVLRKVAELGGEVNYILTGIHGAEAVKRKFPVVGKVIVGEGLLNAQNIEYYINLPYMKETNCFAMRVVDEGMGSGIPNVELALFDMDAEVSTGCKVVCVTKKGEQHIRRFKKLNEETVILYSDNMASAPIILSNNDIAALYRVVGTWRKE